MNFSPPISGYFARAFVTTLLFAQVLCRQPYEDLNLEREWGQEIYRRHIGSVRCSSDPSTDYFQKLTQKLLAQAEKIPYDFKFCVTENLEINAYALPAGGVFIHRGLIRETRNEGELVFVVAHEISHIMLRHAFRMEKRRHQSDSFMARIKKYDALDAAQLTGVLGILSYSREFEKEADLKALDLMQNAGFDPHDAENFMETLRRAEFIKPGIIGRMFSTHPSPQSRRVYIARWINRNKTQVGRTDSEEYRRLKKALP